MPSDTQGKESSNKRINSLDEEEEDRYDLIEEKPQVKNSWPYSYGAYNKNIVIKITKIDIFLAYFEGCRNC